MAKWGKGFPGRDAAWWLVGLESAVPRALPGTGESRIVCRADRLFPCDDRHPEHPPTRLAAVGAGDLSEPALSSLLLHGCPRRGQSWHTPSTIGDKHPCQSSAHKRPQCASLNLKVQGLRRTRWKCGDGESRVLSHPELRRGLTPQVHAPPSPLRRDSVTVPCYKWGDGGTWSLSTGLNKKNGKT